MSKIREMLKEETSTIQEACNNGKQLSFDDYSVLFLASIMEEERNECSSKEE